MNKTLVALTIAASSLLYSGCSRDYKEYNIDGNKVFYGGEESMFTTDYWDIIETKKNSTKIFYNFYGLAGAHNPEFLVDNMYFKFSATDSVSIALNNRLHYLTHKLDSLKRVEIVNRDSTYRDKVKRLIEKINK